MLSEFGWLVSLRFWGFLGFSGLPRASLTVVWGCTKSGFAYLNGPLQKAELPSLLLASVSRGALGW